MCVIEFDPCEVWQEETRKARKEHLCQACGTRIMPGEVYGMVFWVSEGERGFEKSCPACTAARAAFAEAHDGSSPNPSSLAFVLRDCIDEGDRESEERWKPMLEALNARKQTAA